jgi:uncharacterized protein (TIGR02757 family)
VNPDKLKHFLDNLLTKYCVPCEVNSDPIALVRRFKRKKDVEIAGFLAASLAFGNVRQIVSSLENLFSITGARAFEFVRDFQAERGSPVLRFRHRWVTGKDISSLFSVLSQIIADSGSLGSYFRRVFGQTGSVEALLERISAEALGISGLKGREAKTFSRLFFPSPKSGSACKRLNLYLRWMVRREYPDFGLWRWMLPADLIIPLDVHIANAGQKLGLTKRKSRDWKMAVEITNSLRRIEPSDPLKYDFALHRWGKDKGRSMKDEG